MFSVELGHFIYWVPVMKLLKMFAQNLHIYHRNDSTSACITYTFYLHVSLGRRNWLRCRGNVFLAHTVYVHVVVFCTCSVLSLMGLALDLID